MGGEYVCIREGEMAELSFINPQKNIMVFQNMSNEIENQSEHSLNDTYLVVTQLDELILMNHVNNIEIRGLTFTHTSSQGYDYWAWGDKNAIRIVNSVDILIEDCEFSHVG